MKKNFTLKYSITNDKNLQKMCLISNDYKIAVVLSPSFLNSFEIISLLLAYNIT